MSVFFAKGGAVGGPATAEIYRFTLDRTLVPVGGLCKTSRNFSCQAAYNYQQAGHQVPRLVVD